jgi:CheY-like chemotaxis protein
VTTTAPLRLVYLEDDESAFELVSSLLAAESFDCKLEHVMDEAGYRAALHPPPDVILSDFNLPTIDGMAALEIRRKICPDTPFIFVSGALGEAVAIDLLKAGVTDFVLRMRFPACCPPSAVRSPRRANTANASWRNIPCAKARSVSAG